MSLTFYLKVVQPTVVFERNITHNMTKMAIEAGIYKHLWHPDELGVKTARELIVPLRDGLALLRSDPGRFRPYNPSNGWGSYAGLIEFVAGVLAGCEEFPDATIEAST